ncbi:MAG: class II D-tagatose-bisphosphate aldolase, non-catalytic subunit [Bacteroidota bacterium]
MTPSLLNTGSRAQRLVQALQASGRPPVQALVHHLIHGFTDRVTLLAICPNSATVLRAALQAAHRLDAPLLLAATLNQVDTDGGYTGWTPQTLMEATAQEITRVGLDGPVLVGLDHGGPWLKDRHRREGWDLGQTMAAVKRSLEACLDAGYDLLHIDPTVDPALPPDAPLPVERVVERTLDLIAHAEAHRTAQGRPPVSYEVGTEEVHGGLADLDVFDAFLQLLAEGLAARGLERAWPSFVVGKVGTDLHTTTFDASVARRLTNRVKPRGALIKGHYTDYVDAPEAYPLSGLGGANVGPELTEVEFNALMDLVDLERQIGKASGLYEALREAVVQGGRWRKWLRGDEQGLAWDEVAAPRRRWMLRTCSRYIWTDPAVQAARARLYEHLRDQAAPEAYVVWRVQTAIERYLHRFNLIGFTTRLAHHLSEGG